MLIGILGHMGEGKTAAAKHLQRYHDYKILSFSTALKKAASMLFRVPMESFTNPMLKATPLLEWGLTPRSILQILGTECMRDHFGNDFWVKALLHEIVANGAIPPTDDIVIDDVRFPEEIKMVRDLGGKLIRIIRPNNPYLTITTHRSEHVDRNGGYIKVVNNGTIEKLHQEIDAVLIQFLIGGRHEFTTTQS